jgi:cytochrome c oxidase assembly protein subunit 15
VVFLEQMEERMTGFAKFAWFTLAYNLVVILWGVFLRASYSGDGCGQHWITCQGELIPSAPELKTVIEFSHRVSTVIAGFVVIALVIWAFRSFDRGSWGRKTAILSLVFIIIEGLIGRGLVLTGNTAANWTPSRPYWTAGHLINTFILLAFLALTAWLAGKREQFQFNISKWALILIGIGTLAILLVGVSGSMAALTNMLFPSVSLAEGLAKDFDASSHYLLRLRIGHPILSIISAVYLVFLSGWLRSWSPRDANVARWSSVLTAMVILQIGFGAITILTLAPIVMQLGHLLLADAVWISFVLLAASYITSESRPQTLD